MKTISQVAELTGISTRTLQYYDEIGLLNPSELTSSGYRLYNDEVINSQMRKQNHFNSLPLMMEKYLPISQYIPAPGKVSIQKHLFSNTVPDGTHS